MFQEQIENKGLAPFQRVFALNGIEKGATVALIFETQSCLVPAGKAIIKKVRYREI